MSQMKISDVIVQLVELLEQHGDLPVATEVLLENDRVPDIRIEMSWGDPEYKWCMLGRSGVEFDYPR